MVMEVRRKKRLTKDDILKGKDRRESLYVADYDAEVEIRPLTDGELTEIFSLLGNVQVGTTGNPDMTQIDATKNFQALRLATSLGLVEPKLTVDEVAEMKFGVPELIGTKILEISGVTTGENAKKKERK